MNPNIARLAQLPPATRRAFVQGIPAPEVAALAADIDQLLPFIPDAEHAGVVALLRGQGAPHVPQPDAPRPGHVHFHPDTLRRRPAADVHRWGADKDTSESIGRMVTAYPVPKDVPGTLDDIDTFIIEHFANPAHSHGAKLGEDGTFTRHEGPLTLEDTKARTAALRTMSKERMHNENFGGFRDARNTYLFRVNGKETVKPTGDIVAALWTATQTLPNLAQLDLRLNLAGAFAAAQQNGVHICAPGQLQLLATHMQSAFHHLIDIRLPPREPNDFNAQLYRFITQRSTKNGPILEGQEQAVLEKATELWNDAAKEDAERLEKGWTKAREVHGRALELFDGMVLLLNDTYGLGWEPPQGTKPAPQFTLPVAPHGIDDNRRRAAHPVAQLREIAAGRFNPDDVLNELMQFIAQDDDHPLVH